MISDNKLNYYVEVFKRLDETGKNTFNWAACLLFPFWLAYRKMYVETMIFSSILGSIIYPMFLLFKFSVTVSGPIGLAIIVICLFFLIVLASVCIPFGFYGNRIYRYYVTRQILNGYHLMPGYRTTSVLSAIFIPIQPLYLLADIYENTKWQATHKLTESEKEYTEENVIKYLKNDTENHSYGKFAVWFGSLVAVSYWIAFLTVSLTLMLKKTSNNIKDTFSRISEVINQVEKVKDIYQDDSKIDFSSDSSSDQEEKRGKKKVQDEENDGKQEGDGDLENQSKESDKDTSNNKSSDRAEKREKKKVRDEENDGKQEGDGDLENQSKKQAIALDGIKSKNSEDVSEIELKKELLNKMDLIRLHCQ